LNSALEAEAKMLDKIDLAISTGTVLPAQDGSAYDLISDALRTNSISQSNIKPRLLSLSEKLIQMAGSSFETDDLDNTAKLLDLVKPLKVNGKQLEIAETKLKARQKEIKLASIDKTESPKEELALDSIRKKPVSAI